MIVIYPYEPCIFLPLFISSIQIRMTSTGLRESRTHFDEM